ncbi:hypothetical protein [Actinoplanes sp. M2I2]|nr:hypothetical protein [Actinoplanes sp. M2I2]
MRVQVGHGCWADQGITDAIDRAVKVARRKPSTRKPKRAGGPGVEWT